MKTRSDVLLTGVLASTSEALIVLDGEGLLQLASPAACQMLGIAGDPLEGLRLADLLPAEEWLDACAALKDCLAGEETLRTTHKLAKTAGDVNFTWHRPSCEGQDPFIVATFVSDANAQGGNKDEFLANMGHELRNPLTSILAFSEALHDEIYGPLTETQKRSLVSIKDCVLRQLDLITDVVDLSRAESAPFQLSSALCGVEEMVERSQSLVLELARSRSLKVTSEVLPPGVAVMADGKRLRQMLAQVYIAAILSTPVNGKVHLGVRAGTGATGLVIQALSCPPGVEAALPKAEAPDQASMLSALARLAKLRPIGFSLMQKIVSLYGGTMAFHELGCGAWCLSVALPLEPVAIPLSEVPTSAALAKAEGLTGPQQSPLILLADDQAALLSIVCDYLGHKGFRVRTAADGREALDLAEELEPDLVIMDVQMPGMDGLEAIRLLRRSTNSQVANVPIICLSGLAAQGDWERCLAAGANSYLAKPFGVSELEGAIHKMVRVPGQGN